MKVCEAVAAMAEAGWKCLPEDGRILDKTIPDHRGAGGKWRLILNSNPDPKPVLVDGVAAIVPPFHALVYWNGWPAGVIGIYGGVMVRSGAAGEADLVASIRMTRPACG